MFVAIQFPIADGRVFVGDSGVVERPNWQAPQIGWMPAYNDFVRGFGRLAYRRRETDAGWTDEDFFAYAKGAVRFPTLERRHFRGPDGSLWMVRCRFRRLFSDGDATVRVEIGFRVEPDEVPAESVVRELLHLPAVVPGEWDGPAKDLILLGPHLARRYARVTTRNGRKPASGLVAAGDPIVVAEAWWTSAHPQRPADADAVAADAGTGSDAGTGTGLPQLSAAATRTRYGRIETWYQGEAPRTGARNLRLVLLRQHAQEQTLDHVLRWMTSGALRYVPLTETGDRLETYVNNATRIVNRDNDRGVACGPLRDALDAVTATQRNTVDVRRRTQLDGMRRQVRAKAERFLAEREVRRPTFNVYGAVTVGDQNFSGTFYGPVANTVYAQTLENSFNTFAAAEPNDDLKKLVAQLHQQVAVLVAQLRASAPEEAAEVTEAVSTFTEEAAKKTPNKITLRALGQGIVDVAQTVAGAASPLISTVTAVLKLFGIAAP